MTSRVACPLVADAQATGHGAAPVHGQQFAMIAGEDPERMRREQGMERPHLDTRLTQPSPKPVRRADGAEGVVEHAHGDAGAGFDGQRIVEACANPVVADDVVLEMNPLGRAGDFFEHRGERPGAVGVVEKDVPADRRCPGRAVDSEPQGLRHRRPKAASAGRSA